MPPPPSTASNALTNGLRDTPPWAREAAFLLLLGAVAIALRWPSFGTNGFHNEDAAGITYNADLLARGLVPLKDDVEFKGPGAFYLVWAFWSVFGRSITVLTKVVAFWSVGVTVAVYLTGRVMFGWRAAAVAATLYTILSPTTDSIDINYHAWMALPYVGATALFVAGLKRGRSGSFVASGLVLGIAALIKHQSIVLAPLFGGVILLWPFLERPEGWAAPRRFAPLACMAVGGVSAFAGLGVYYFTRDGLEAYFRTYFMAEAGWHYVKGTMAWNDKALRLFEGVWGLWEFLALPTVLMVAAVFATVRSRGLKRRPSLLGVLLAGHFVMSFVGASIGFRYFKSYYLQVLPAAVWLAALPEGPVTRMLSPGFFRAPAAVWKRRALPGLLVAAFALPALASDLGDLRQIRQERRVARDSEAQKLGKIIRENSQPGDRVWVWGRWAWPVYYHADRVAGTPYYKVLELLTTTLTNTWRRPTENVRFRADGPWREVIDDLKRVKPAFIAVSHNEDYHEFKALVDLLAHEYVVVPDTGTRTLTLYRRKDVKLAKPPVPPAPRRPVPPKMPIKPPAKAPPKTPAAPATAAAKP